VDFRAGLLLRGGSFEFFAWLTQSLCAGVKFLVEMDTPRKGGTTLRQNLMQAGRPIEPPEIPPEGKHVWLWFWDLHQGRGGGFGPAPLAYGEIEAWGRLLRTAPRAWEVEMLRQMDVAYLSAVAKLAEKGS